MLTASAQHTPPPRAPLSLPSRRLAPTPGIITCSSIHIYPSRIRWKSYKGADLRKERPRRWQVAMTAGSCTGDVCVAKRRASP
jgi:hypothetical protein